LISELTDAMSSFSAVGGVDVGSVVVGSGAGGGDVDEAGASDAIFMI
jgi:hypothetical protein